jgi:hypothetical protein
VMPLRDFTGVSDDTASKATRYNPASAP